MLITCATNTRLAKSPCFSYKNLSLLEESRHGLFTHWEEKTSQTKLVLHCYVHCTETVLSNESIAQPVMMDI